MLHDAKNRPKQLTDLKEMANRQRKILAKSPIKVPISVDSVALYLSVGRSSGVFNRKIGENAYTKFKAEVLQGNNL